ncbi:hypothetical protein A7J32_06120 [Mycobacterium mungi]|uniref:Uncharacterized protein n=1 Tax=Mycobacterium mungi TaxID=1844474 RepID=A0ABX2VN13_9MYCO|nr:hypothetical protein A7J32_06120 [Mycobacterium mungi]
MFVGSDVAAFIEHTREAVELGQDQAVVITYHRKMAAVAQSRGLAVASADGGVPRLQFPGRNAQVGG